MSQTIDTQTLSATPSSDGGTPDGVTAGATSLQRLQRLSSAPMGRTILRSFVNATLLAALILSGFHWLCVHEYRWVARMF